MKKYFLLILLNIFSSYIFAQEAISVHSYALPFLTLQQSPLLSGAGQIGTAIPMQDAIGFYYNPAQIGYFSRTNSLSGFFMPQKSQPVSLLPEVSFQNSSVTIGYHVNSPLSIGFGYIHNKVSYGIFSTTNPNNPNSTAKYENYDSFDGYTIGFGYNYYMHFNFGFAIKSYRSVLNDFNQNNQSTFRKIDGTAYDFGALIIAPVSQLLFRNAKFYITDDASLKPDIAFTLGYSLSNVGDKVSYIDPAQADPLPRTARLGYSFNFGLDLSLLGVRLNTVDYSFTAEAEDILLESNADTTGINYQSMFGDISLKDNLIDLKGDGNVIVHRGHIFRLFETVILTSGRINGSSYRNIKSNGFGVSTEGLFKLLSTMIDNSTINYIADHLVIEYYNSKVIIERGNDNSFKGLAIYVRSVSF